MQTPDFAKVERVVQIKKLHDPDDSLDYWLSKTIEERFAALEYLRQQWMPNAAQSRFQRVCTITQRSRG
jgi:hypothetical protein